VCPGDSSNPPGDRVGDRPTIVSGLTKPPVLSRATLRTLCLFCLAIIVYGTLGPLGQQNRPWIVTVPAWRWVPPLQPTDRNDAVTNFAVYLPVGIAFRLLVRRRGQAGRLDLLWGLSLSVGLSYLTEVFQQAMPARSSSFTDVLINGMGALVGCWIAVPVQATLRRLHAFVFLHLHLRQRPWTVMAWATAATTAFLMTMPWRLTRPSVELGLDRPLGAADLRRLAMFGVVGLVVTVAALMRGRSRVQAAGGALLRVGLLAVALEALQAVLGGHVCSLVHALMAVGGAAAGSAAAVALTRAEAVGGPQFRLPTDRLRKLATLALVATTLYATTARIWQGASQGRARAEPAVQWVPFAAQFTAPFSTGLADVLEQVALYGFLTLLCMFLTRGHGRGLALLLLLGLVGLIEVSKAFLSRWGADITAPLLALLAWLVAVRVWKSVCPATSSRQVPPAPLAGACST
jgi:VanZ family protein